MYKKIWGKVIEILVTGLIIAILVLLLFAATAHGEYIVTPNQAASSSLGKGHTPTPVSSSILPHVSNATSTTESTSTERQYIDEVSIVFGVNPSLSECIVSHESQWSDKTGDDGNSRGYWQISNIWHPEVSNAVAYSFVSSTIWSIQWISLGHIRQWSTYREYCSGIPVVLNQTGA